MLVLQLHAVKIDLANMKTKLVVTEKTLKNKEGTWLKEKEELLMKKKEEELHVGLAVKALRVVDVEGFLPLLS